MGFSLTGAHVIFFIAAVIAAGAVSGIFAGSDAAGPPGRLRNPAANRHSILDKTFQISYKLRVEAA